MSKAAHIHLSHGEKYPYHGKPPKDWAERAALGVLAEVGGRSGIDHALDAVEGDEELSEEIVLALADIIRTASPRTSELCEHGAVVCDKCVRIAVTKANREAGL